MLYPCAIYNSGCWRNLGPAPRFPYLGAGGISTLVISREVLEVTATRLSELRCRTYQHTGYQQGGAGGNSHPVIRT